MHVCNFFYQSAGLCYVLLRSHVVYFTRKFLFPFGPFRQRGRKIPKKFNSKKVSCTFICAYRLAWHINSGRRKAEEHKGSSLPSLDRLERKTVPKQKDHFVFFGRLQLMHTKKGHFFVCFHGPPFHFAESAHRASDDSDAILGRFRLFFEMLSK